MCVCVCVYGGGGGGVGILYSSRVKQYCMVVFRIACLTLNVVSKGNIVGIVGIVSPDTPTVQPLLPLLTGIHTPLPEMIVNVLPLTGPWSDGVPSTQTAVCSVLVVEHGFQL